MKGSNQKILRLLLPYRPHIIIASFLMLIEVGFNVWQPRLMQKIVDEGVIGSDMDLVYKMGLLMLGVAFMGGLGGFLSCIMSNTYAQKFGNDLRKELFSKVIRLSDSQISKYTEGTLINRITADSRIISEFSSILIQMIVKPFLLFVFGSVMIFTINRPFGLIVLLAVPVQLIIMFFFISKTSPLFASIQKKLDKISSLALQLVGNNRLIKAYAREDYEAERFDDANRSLMNTTLRVQKLMAILNPLILLLLNGVMLLIIYAAGVQVQTGYVASTESNIGQIMAAISYSQQIMMSLMMAGTVFQHVAKSKASAARIDEILAMDSEIKSGSIEDAGEVTDIKIDNVSFSYSDDENARPVLSDISFEVKRGQRVLIVGATGSGKSTLVRLLARSYDPTMGSILLNGHPLTDLSLKELRRKISVVFQDSDFLADTIAANICYGSDTKDEQEMKRAASIAQADEFIEGLKNGYKTRLSENGMSVSGGQRQRLAIARAIMSRPEILIMDDSTSSLDSDTEKALFEGLRDAGIPIVIMVAQRITGLLDADLIVLLNEGRIEYTGTHEQLMAKSARYREIVASQSAGEVTHD
ncbi:MAG: ABC transporter ATP-binding protein/permease [Saccharofermentans sp.]|nr:ABC transporter ATP-binding protein/permease [Saccharofermentans sp.]